MKTPFLNKFSCSEHLTRREEKEETAHCQHLPRYLYSHSQINFHILLFFSSSLSFIGGWQTTGSTSSTLFITAMHNKAYTTIFLRALFIRY